MKVDFCEARSTKRRPTGDIIAPPNPCKNRAPINSVTFELMPQRIEPSVKMTIARRNTRLPPNRSASQPLTGMNTARLKA